MPPVPRACGNDLPDPDAAMMCGHRRLLEEVLLRAVTDTHSLDRLVRLEARRWFQARDPSPFGWQWIADELRLSDGNIERLERYARCLLDVQPALAKRPRRY